MASENKQVTVRVAGNIDEFQIVKGDQPIEAIRYIWDRWAGNLMIGKHVNPDHHLKVTWHRNGEVSFKTAQWVWEVAQKEANK